MKSDDTNFMVIFRTGKSYEIEMASNTLRENDIPFHLQEETSGGLKVAMPVRPSPGPGIWWSIHVPEEKANEAKQILSELPMEVDTDPDIWHFGPTERKKRGWKVFAAIMLLLFLAWLVKSVLGIFL